MSRRKVKLHGYVVLEVDEKETDYGAYQEMEAMIGHINELEGANGTRIVDFRLGVSDSAREGVNKTSSFSSWKRQIERYDDE